MKKNKKRSLFNRVVNSKTSVILYIVTLAIFYFGAIVGGLIVSKNIMPFEELMLLCGEVMKQNLLILAFIFIFSLIIFFTILPIIGIFVSFVPCLILIVIMWIIYIIGIAVTGKEEKVLKAGSILINKNTKKIGLVFRKKQEDYSFAKGHLEEGETLIECAKRETEEETGRKVKIISEKELGVLKYITKKGEDVENYLFLAIDDGDLDTEIPESLKEELKWFEFEEVEQILTHKNLKEFWNLHKKEIKKYMEEN